MTKEKIICRVYSIKESGQRLVTIPKKYKDIEVGDFVEIKKKELK